MRIIVLILTVLQACTMAQPPQKEHSSKETTNQKLEKEGFAPSSQLKIHYYQFSKAAPLLIINGGPGMNCEGFKGIAQLLADDYRWLASYYATQHPESIDAMVLSSSGGISLQLLSSLDITGRLSQLERDSLRYWRNKIQQGDTSYHAAYQRGKYLAPAYLYNRDYIPQIAERLTQGNMQVNGLVFQNLRSMNFDCSQGLQNYKKPVLIIQGKQDIIPEAVAQEAKAAGSIVRRRI